MSGSIAVFDALAHALAEIRERLGDPPFGDRRRTIALLADRVPDARREIRAVGTAIDEGVPQALLVAERHLLGLEIDRLSDRLESTTGLRGDIARPIVRALSYGLGLGPLPSLYVDTASPAVPPPPPFPDRWAGLSQPVHAPPAPVHRAQTQRKKPAPGTILIANKRYPKTQVYLWGGLLAVGAAGLTLNEMSAPEPAAPIIAGNTGPGGQQNGVVPVGIGGEDTDFGVQPKRELETNVGAPTPTDIPVGKRITTAQLQALLAQDQKTLLVDVLAQQHPQTLKGAHFVPGGGLPGTVTDANQAPFEAVLKTLSEGNPQRALVFFCAGAQCWESYNAVLRAGAAGYRNVHWYRGGLASWAQAGLPMEPLPSESRAR
ncbi:rhodanese-like domain-containing protein [Sphingomonas sp. M1-B02]|uniref:rhodanese-like domain-containing protein n=1 Tax=Sphingomonas sp. M1-B02 TaxID=3114300 RepID=UPI00223E96D2|nr:rhodanese-like domain-containing protein [Sphingomonas sp. S6-11]UZK67843.1 rhodanese-like domain-containing protein [Sphingomonas sp. S6-11]